MRYHAAVSESGRTQPPMYDSALTAMAAFEREQDVRRNFCRICWGPLDECPGHKGWMEMFGPPPSEQELAEYRADHEVRARGLERKAAALEAAVIAQGYETMADFMEKHLVPWEDD